MRRAKREQKIASKKESRVDVEGETGCRGNL